MVRSTARCIPALGETSCVRTSRQVTQPYKATALREVACSTSPMTSAMLAVTNRVFRSPKLAISIPIKIVARATSVRMGRNYRPVPEPRCKLTTGTTFRRSFGGEVNVA